MDISGKTIKSLYINGNEVPIGGGYSATDLFNADLDLVFTGLTTIPNNPAGQNDSGKFQRWNNIKSISFPDLVSVGSYGCYKMFSNCASLSSVDRLQATALNDYCYACMFQSTSLTSVPTLPAMTMKSYCYQYMFNNCSSLTAISELPATTLDNYCYAYMFSVCESLTNASIELPATTLKNYCYYNMFYKCTTLQTIPSLAPAKLADRCYANMFQNCTSLTGTITIQVKNTNTSIPTEAFTRMFQGCTNLTKVILDFSTFSSIPTLGSWSNINVFFSTTDTRFEIHVPSALEESWKTASNWSTWASHIVGV